MTEHPPGGGGIIGAFFMRMMKGLAFRFLLFAVFIILIPSCTEIERTYYPHQKFRFTILGEECSYSLLSSDSHVGAGLTRCRDTRGLLDPQLMTTHYSEEDTLILGGSVSNIPAYLYFLIPFSSVKEGVRVDIPARDIHYWGRFSNWTACPFLKSGYVFFDTIVLSDQFKNTYFAGSFHFEGEDKDGGFSSSKEYFDLSLTTGVNEMFTHLKKCHANE